MTDFAPPMISRTYERVAKPFVSLGERNPFAFAVFPPRRGPKRKDREIRAASRSEMAPGRFAVEGKENSTRRLSYQSLTTVMSGAAGFFIPTTW